ncbi:TPA: DUF4355 domain-containing protein [Streptococcus agalactiae]|uniref:DUF4355 domain-containing protein n=1 Tax=Streptococcus agalactiae TaxID=1311 RepID=UPI002AC30D50|nr:DUF4355 domain-containing protein [Streptococcus agalactiae]HEN4382569.1 DUF4355 domain-containing protein [Streptococcus agalactiae]HEO2540760.1 DUF4355 domain-containing protein [Streptococcus agalactiae]
MADLVENGVVEEVAQEEVDTQVKEQTEATTEKTFTQEEVTEMIKQNVNRAVAKAHKDAQEQFKAEQDEAKKLAEMNDKEKADYETQKLLEELQELKNDKTRNELTAVARKMFLESNINVDDDILSFAVTLDAEQTKANVTKLASAFAKAIADDRKSSARQTTPNLGSGAMTTQTNFGANLASKVGKSSTKLY